MTLFDLPPSPMALRPFFGYFGGKWRDAVKHYPPPSFDTIIEPFAGSAGYALRYPDRKVILGELDPRLAAMWRYLIAVDPEEILNIPDIPEGGTVDDLDICDEAKSLVGFWLNRGASAPRRSPSKWMREGIRPGSFWGERVRKTIAGQVGQIRHWQVVEGSYADLVLDFEATWFVDPPYQLAGKDYRFGSDRIDFSHLSQWCRTRPGQVIVCENQGANWLPFTDLSDVKTTRAGSRSKEVVWVSG